uniref:matrix metalloproteinase-17-like n=1 Tax=Pristiophorus japonicus TaxID=55135 RepID=UPI00398EBA5F
DRGTDLFTVAVHEFGHALGLSHTASKTSIMRPYYQGPVGDPLQYRLQPDDRSEIERLYGSRNSPDDTGLEHGIEPSRFPSLPESPGRRPSIRPGDQSPDRCRTSFDAVAQIRGETFFFKGRYFWRLTHSGHLASLRPARLSRFWRGLPGNLDRVDAVYERAADHKIVFFTGSQYWLFKDNRAEEGYPRPVSDFGLPDGGVEAAFSREGQTYFLKDGQLWRYDEAERRLEPGYPSQTWPWRDLPREIDAAMSWSDGGVYFFSGRDCWRYTAEDGDRSAGYPRAAGQRWMGCEQTAAGEDVAGGGGGEERGGGRAEGRPGLRGEGAGWEGEPCLCGNGCRLGSRRGALFPIVLAAIVKALPLAGFV